MNENPRSEKQKRKILDSVLERCRDDAVIVVVYTQQIITVPFSHIEAMGPDGYGELTRKIAVQLLRNHGLVVEIKKEVGAVYKEASYEITGLGHAGVCAIDGLEEKAYYFEFGRYGDENGIVRLSHIFGSSRPIAYEGENPELDELQSLCEALRKTNYTRPVNFEGIYVKTQCGSAKNLIARARSQMPNRRGSYSLTDNHCMTFAIDMAAVAGVDVSAARQATGFDLTDADREMVADRIMNHDVGDLMTFGAKLMGRNINEEKKAMIAETISNLENEITQMIPPSHMIEELQKIWNKLNHAPFIFEDFQEKPLQKKS